MDSMDVDENGEEWSRLSVFAAGRQLQRKQVPAETSQRQKKSEAGFPDLAPEIPRPI